MLMYFGKTDDDSGAGWLIRLYAELKIIAEYQSESLVTVVKTGMVGAA